MVILSLAKKNLKILLKNFVLIPVLIGMPVFQIYMLSTVMSAVPAATGRIEGFVELILMDSQTVSPSQFFSASVLVMFVLITGMIAATSIAEEREKHTLLRVFAAPVSKMQIIIGNLVGQVVYTLFIAGSIMLITNQFFQVDWGTSWVNLLVVTIFLVYVAISLGFVFAGVFKDAKTASGVMSFLIVVMSFLSDGLTGGGNFDFTSKFTINKWAYDAYIAVMQGKPLPDFLTNVGVLFLVGTMLAIIAAMLFRRENIYE